MIFPFRVLGVLCMVGSLLTHVAPCAAEEVESPPVCFQKVPVAMDSHAFSTHRSWQAEHGLPQNSVQAITQTRDGYLWLATFGGLARFDGVRFRTYNTGNTPNFTTNRLLTLFQDRAGRLWIGGEGGALMCLEADRVQPFGLAEGVPQSNIAAICETPDGTLWIGADDGLFRREGARFVRADSPATGANRVIALWPTPDGRIFFGRKEGVFVLHNGQTAALQLLPQAALTCLFRDRQNRFWIGSEWGVFVWQEGAPPRQFLKNDGLSHNLIHSVTQDPAGRIWIGTGLGVTVFENENLRPATELELANQEVQGLHLDGEGNLWAGTTTGGVHVFAPTRLAAISLPVRNDPSVTAILQDQSGTIWVSTSCSGLHRIRGNQLESLWIPCVWAMAEDRTGALWLGMYTGSLRRLAANRLTLYGNADGLPGSAVVSLLVAQDGHTLWIGTNVGLAQRTPDGRFHDLTRLPNAPQTWVRTLLEAPDGSLWIAADSGLFHFQNGQFSRFTTRDGLGNPFVRALHLDANHILWVGTYGGGLHRIDHGSCCRIRTADGLLDDVVSFIHEDSEGNFWLSGNRGLSRVARSELEDFCLGRRSRVDPLGYTKADGMPDSETNGGFQPAACRLRDGTVLFPTIKGVARLAFDRTNRQSPPLLIESVAVNGVAQPVHPQSVFAPGVRRMEITYTGLSFSVPEKVRFRYRLEGTESDWIDAGSRRTAFYTNLAPGTYRFIVTACNNEGLWNEAGTTLTFTIQPFFYQTRWFQALWLLIVIGTGWGLYELRVRHLLARAFHLEMLVRERTENLRREKEKTEAANQSQTRLLSLIAHDLKNPLFAIAGWVKLARENLKNRRSSEVCDEPLHSINNEVQDMIGFITTLLDSAALEAGRLRLSRHRLDLAELVKTVAARQPVSVPGRRRSR
ncbi:MAG: hypothetical protein K1Y36_18695 [Blastocatellia bacterium]|nr:hypothetical protein [Blastocatellia bacterium]